MCSLTLRVQKVADRHQVHIVLCVNGGIPEHLFGMARGAYSHELLIFVAQSFGMGGDIRVVLQMINESIFSPQ